MIEEKVRRDLFVMQDEGYRDFYAPLVPTLARECVIGVRIPLLRKYAKKLRDEGKAEEFLSILPHKFYDENNLHAFLIEGLGDYQETVCALDAFLPYVDNWATCDMLRPKIFSKNTDALYGKVREWISSEHPYTVRYGVGMLCSYYLGDAFSPDHLALAATIKSDEYYVQMMVAWYFATALAQQREAAWPYFQERKLEAITHRMAVRKAIESKRIDDETKRALRALLR